MTDTLTSSEAPASKPRASGPLAGIRIVEFAGLGPGPFASMMLADMGADVVRVEKREGGEDRWVQSVTEGGEGGTFLQCNRNKRSLTLDTTTDEGREITRKLVAKSDIVVANILSNPLKVLAPLLSSLVAPGGTLVMSGVLDRQWREVAAVYAPMIALAPWQVADAWVCLAGRMRGPMRGPVRERDT